MIIAYAESKLRRFGFVINWTKSFRSPFDGHELKPDTLYARRNGWIIAVYRNGDSDSVALIYANRENDPDHSAGSYFKTLPAAIRFATREG